MFEDKIREKKMRVGVVSARGINGRGGIARVLSTLLSEYERAGEIRAVSIKTVGPGPKVIRFILSPIYYFYFVIKIIIFKFDIFHINMSSHGSFYRKSLYCRTAVFFKVPFIIHLHGGRIEGFYRNELTERGRNTVKYIFQQANAVAVLGDHWRNFVIEDFGVSKDRVYVISNAVPDPLTTFKHTALSTPEQIPSILFLGKLGKNKGSLRLIQALGSESLRNIEWHADIAGDGDTQKHINLARNLGIDNKVSVHGWIVPNEVRILFSKCKIFVLPSEAECQPVSVIEAMAWGCAIITTPVGAMTDFGRHRKNLLFIGAHDQVALESALVELLIDQDLYNFLRNSARATYEKRFNPSIQASNFIQIYRRIIEG